MAIWTEWPITSHRQTLVNNQLKKTLSSFIVHEQGKVLGHPAIVCGCTYSGQTRVICAP